MTSEAALDTIHPSRSVGVDVASSRNSLQLGEQVHIDVNGSPLVSVTEVGLEASSRTLDDHLTTTPVGDHLAPQRFVGIIGDRTTETVGFRHLGERKSNDGRSLVKFDAAPRSGGFTFPVGLESGGGEVEAATPGRVRWCSTGVQGWCARHRAGGRRSGGSGGARRR